jgi:precorrin-2 dehydrogenase/sirohydrochlorin ferrochelatase/precorrin-6A/cobalt-precorrin-6A reductase
MSEHEKRILLFGGTTEGRALIETGLPLVYSAATEYGANIVEPASGSSVISGRMSSSAMSEMLSLGDFAGVIDATHPYAAEVKRNISSACGRLGVPLFRVIRPRSSGFGEGNVMDFATCEDAAHYLRSATGNALIAVGSKELERFTVVPEYRSRLFVRVLPTSEAISLCERLGFPPSNIIAEQGPFSTLSNMAHLDRARAGFLVTKDGGAAGGFTEKLEAASSHGAALLVIRRPDEYDESGYGLRGTVDEAMNWARKLLGWDMPPSSPAISRFPIFPMFISLKGRGALVIGAGSVARRKAEVLLKCGALLRVASPRVLDKFRTLEGLERTDFTLRPYSKEDMINPLPDGTRISMVIAASGDREANRRAGLDALELSLPVNVADAPEECSFFFPSFIEHDGFVAGVSSSGQSPALCRRLADRLRTMWVELVTDVRKA